MKIAIIGSGNVGKALAGSATKAGHSVTISAQHPHHALDAARATKAHAANSNQEAVKDAELGLARQVIESLVGEFEPEDALVSEYRRDLRTLLEAKLAGEEITRPEPVPETPVVDLMEALKRSVAEADRRKKAKPAGATGKRRTPARKSA